MKLDEFDPDISDRDLPRGSVEPVREDLDVEDGAIEKKQIAGKWHIITLQEAIEYVEPRAPGF